MVNFGTFLSGQLILQHIPNFWRVAFECQLLKKKFRKDEKEFMFLCSFVMSLTTSELFNLF